MGATLREVLESPPGVGGSEGGTRGVAGKNWVYFAGCLKFPFQGDVDTKSVRGTDPPNWTRAFSSCLKSQYHDSFSRMHNHLVLARFLPES